MMNQHQQSLVSLMLATCPEFQSRDPEAALAAYEIVMNEADDRDLHPGVMMIINGRLPGHHHAYAPTSAQLATAIRMAMEKRVAEEVAERKKLEPPPEDQWRNPSPEHRLENKAVLSNLVAELAEVDPAAPPEKDKAEADKKVLERWAKVNKRHQPDMSPEAVAKRLGLTIRPQRAPTSDSSSGEAA